MGRLPLIVSYALISLKARSTLHSLLTYTLAFIQQSTWHFIPNPNINLSCFSHHHKPQHTSIASKAANKTWQKHNHDSKVYDRNIGILELNKHVISFKHPRHIIQQDMFIFIIQSNHACSCKCMPYLIYLTPSQQNASMDGNVNTCLWY